MARIHGYELNAQTQDQSHPAYVDKGKLRAKGAVSTGTLLTSGFRFGNLVFLFETSQPQWIQVAQSMYIEVAACSFVGR